MSPPLIPDFPLDSLRPVTITGDAEAISPVFTLWLTLMIMFIGARPAWQLGANSCEPAAWRSTSRGSACACSHLAPFLVSFQHVHDCQLAREVGIRLDVHQCPPCWV